MLMENPERIGYIINRAPGASWRDTVVHYARHRNLISECVNLYDKLVNEEGWQEPWAALRALDQFCCADIIVGCGAQAMPLPQHLN